MPAVTPIYGLPYQVGSDPPCFGPGTGCDNLESLWCDFMTIVEAQLDENDAVVGRTGTAIPMARVSFRSSTGGDFLNTELFANGFLAFDTVDFDTDGMADLPFGIAPRRNGIYMVDVTIFGFDTVEIGFAQSFSLEVGGQPIPATLIAVQSGTGSHFRASALVEFSDIAPIPRTLQVTLKSLFGADANAFSASMNVYWHSEL